MDYKDGRESRGERRTLWCGIKIKDEYIRALVLRQQHPTTLSV
ncbi:MAG TPA: hypothetical protein VN703_06835 [Candidatus Sulfopaludibacter sp.]|nr:hypothetical protein [Candidatus Sulfopaludibacter sp.]